jgi:TolC family type I secretion outer membrane protein
LITIDEAVEIALRNNAGLQASKAEVDAAHHGTRAARLDLLPKVDLEVGYARMDPATVRRSNVFVDIGRSLVEQFGGPDADPNDIRPGAYSNTFSTILQIRQPIYNGGAGWAQAGIARTIQENKELLYEDTKHQIILDTKQGYLYALKANELVVLARKSLESAQQHFENTQKMLAVGLRSRADVLRWEVEKANSEGNLVEAENTYQLALAALKEVMGLPLNEPVSLSPLAHEPVKISETVEEQMKKSRHSHPTLRAANASADAQRAGVRLAWAAFQPKLNFVYQLGWEQNNTLKLDSFHFWNAGITLSVPVFHSFANLSRLQEQKASLRRSEEKTEDAVRKMELQVLKSRLKVDTSLKRFNIARKAVEHSEENLRVINNSYNVGMATNIDVLDAELIHTQTQSDLIQARYDYWIARAELDRSIGVPND